MVSILQKVVWMRRIRNFGFRVDLDLANGGKIKISWENIHLSMLTVKQGNLIIAIDWSPHPTTSNGENFANCITLFPGSDLMNQWRVKKRF